jgi:hypothetical protein
LVQQVQQVQAVMMGRTVQMEKFPMHRAQQDRLDLKEHLVLQDLQDPRDQLVLPVQQDQQVQAQELLGQPVQLELLVLREVLDQQGPRDQRARQVARAQLEQRELEVKLEQLVQRASLKLLSQQSATSRSIRRLL